MIAHQERTVQSCAFFLFNNSKPYLICNFYKIINEIVVKFFFYFNLDSLVLLNYYSNKNLLKYYVKNCYTRVRRQKV